MILISPWARKTTDGTPSPKNYPYWGEVVQSLVKMRLEVIQVSCSGEESIGAPKRLDDLSLSEVEKMIQECKVWISVDNFWHHMAWTLGKPGIVIFGSSDPVIFGHPENMNLLKDRRFLRTRQFGLWSQEKANNEIFVGPAVVVNAVLLSLERLKQAISKGSAK
jgi:hypothetical protein